MLPKIGVPPSKFDLKQPLKDFLFFIQVGINLAN